MSEVGASPSQIASTTSVLPSKQTANRVVRKAVRRGKRGSEIELLHSAECTHWASNGMIFKGTRARDYVVPMSPHSAHQYLTHHLAMPFLVNHALRGVREVTELRLPHNEGARIFEGVPAIEEDLVGVTHLS